MSGDVLLSVRDLRVEAGGAQILRGVSLEVGRGRILGVVGESGSGKSTLALCLMRLLPEGVRASGAVVLDGQELLGLPVREVERLRGSAVAMVFQDPMGSLNPVFTVGTHLVDVVRRRHPGVGRAAARGRAAAMLGQVGIADAARRMEQYPHELSGGLRQRAAIAMALLAEPALLVADEPTTALDATVEAQVAALFAALREGAGGFRGSVVFISHQLGLVAQLCDEVCVMYAGTVSETGTVGEVLGSPRHPYTAALVACEPGDGDGRGFRSIPGEVPGPGDALPGCVFAPRCPLAEAVCREEAPALREVEPGRMASCHFAAAGSVPAVLGGLSGG